ncbi:MAG: uroporphyrinogen decarboxylase family protein [Candidatus Bipolaricaulia bacterium]
MTHQERIQAAMRGEPVDRAPIALWRHFPHDDATAEGFSRAVVDFQRKYDFDLVKVTPVAGYPAEAWGAELIYADNDEGTRDYRSRPVNDRADWSRLPILNPDEGVLGRELEALQRIRDALGGDAPILETIFSPLTIAWNLSGDRWLEDLRHHPEDLHAGLKTIAETTTAFARASVKTGADGIFFATQLATTDLLTEVEYRTFGVAYDRQVLDAITDEADPILLHIHGVHIMFDLLADYPAGIVNWHDRRTEPTLADALARVSGAVLGGLNEWDTLLHGSPDDVRAEIADALAQTEGRRVIIGAGCVTPVTAPEANLHAARQAVEETG